jgi:ABC-2 type transport system ATP-binding protein
MLEADALCDRVAVIDRGRLVAEGTPGALKGAFGAGSVVEATLRATPAGILEAARALPGVEHAELGSDGGFGRLRLFARPEADLRAQVEALCGADNLEGLVARDRTLEEAYLALLRAG